MNTMQKSGGLAALYLAVSYLAGMLLFLVVLDYLSIVDPAQKAALVVERPALIYVTNLLMYVLFGFGLGLLVMALHDRLQDAAPALARGAAGVGLLWAGALIVSGMVSNAGIAPLVDRYALDPVQATAAWLNVETVAGGLSGANGEILGGVFTLLVSLAGLRARALPRGVNYLGLLVGAAGVLSTVPALNDLVGVFGIVQMVWFVWLGVILLQPAPHRRVSLAPSAR